MSVETTTGKDDYREGRQELVNRLTAEYKTAHAEVLDFRKTLAGQGVTDEQFATFESLTQKKERIANELKKVGIDPNTVPTTPPPHTLH